MSDWITGKHFSAQQITVDGKKYRNCEFRKCQIVYGATGPVELDGVQFTDCEYALVGAALKTLNYLTEVYKFNPELVEQTFANIRNGKHQETYDLPPIDL